MSWNLCHIDRTFESLYYICVTESCFSQSLQSKMVVASNHSWGLLRETIFFGAITFYLFSNNNKKIVRRYFLNYKQTKSCCLLCSSWAAGSVHLHTQMILSCHSVGKIILCLKIWIISIFWLLIFLFFHLHALSVAAGGYSAAQGLQNQSI